MFKVRKARVLLVLSLVMGSLQSQAATLRDWEPTYQDSTKIVYETTSADGIVVRPGEILPMPVPLEYQKRIIDFVGLTHKQKPSDFVDDGARRNLNAGYTSFEILASDNAAGDLKGDDWRVWGGRGSGPLGLSKYAESRKHEGETDNLYEWAIKGHRSIMNDPGKISLSPLRPAAFRIRSVGTGNIIVTKVIVKFRPQKITSTEDHIFSKGLVFGNSETSRGRIYPNDPYNGDYGSAVILNLSSRDANKHIPPEVTWVPAQQGQRGQIIVNTDPDSNKHLAFVDVACGDMNPVPQGADPEKLRGDGKLFVSIETERGSYEDIMTNENIGSNGVMRALVPRELIPGKIKRVIISGKGKAPISVMGVRLGYN